MDVPLTPVDFIARARRLFPDRIGVVEGDRTWTYAEFADRADRLARLVRDDLAVPEGGIVAWLCGNTHELLEAYFGVLQAGAVLLPLNIRLAPAELRTQLEHSRSHVLFRHPDQADPGWSGPTVVLDDGYEARLDAQPEGQVVPALTDEHAPAEVFYTSGSTGLPKGAVLTHRALYLHGLHNGFTNAITGDDVIVHLIPLFHVNGWGTPHFLTAVGGTHVMLPRFDAGEVLRLIEAHRVTRLFAVPTMVRMLLDHPDLDRRDLSSLVQASIGGAPSSPELLAEIEDRIGCETICGYGMTEAAPTVTRSLDRPGTPKSRDRRATTGLPILGVDARVLDDAGAEVPADGRTVGEICVRSNHVMSGYLDDPDATAAVIIDGWLHTGDLAVVRPDGYLQIVDRTKDLIVSGGENVASPEVEHALTAHPAVREAAVVGRPDDRWGEVPVAFVSLHAGASVTPEELIAFVRDRLAGFKAPKVVRILDHLPVGGTGKVSKLALRERARAELSGPEATAPPG